MKEQGIVIDYDGYTGTIKNDVGKDYLLLKKEIVDNQELNIGDKVSFVPDEFATIEYNKNIARFVKKKVLKKD